MLTADTSRYRSITGPDFIKPDGLLSGIRAP